MGVRRVLSFLEIKTAIRDYPFNLFDFVHTKDGISDTVYILFTDCGKFVFKLYEKASFKEIKEELFLLEKISSLPVPKALFNKNMEKITPFRGKYFVIYSFLEGSVPVFVKEAHLREIGEFMASFHALSRSISVSRENEIGHKKVTRYLNRINEKDREDFIEIYEKVKFLEIGRDGVIHGDLFLDNSKFIKDKLSGVLDFSDFSMGSFLIDIGVVLSSWCFQKERFNLKLIEAFLSSYDKKVSFSKIKDYMIFSLLYYSLKRYFYKSKNYKELLKRAKILSKEAF